MVLYGTQTTYNEDGTEAVTVAWELRSESVVKSCNIMSVIQCLYVAGIIWQATYGMHKN